MNQKIKLLVADKQDLFRESLVALLKNREEFDVIGHAGNGKDLIEILKQKHCHVTIINNDLPVIDGKRTLEIIKRRFPEVKVIVLSDYLDHNITTEFMVQGANCYLNKNCKAQTLREAIVTVKDEGYFFDSSSSKALLESMIKSKNTEGSHNPVIFNDRETEILRKICDGQTNKEIALSLNLSTSTIDFHKNKIYIKTRCNNSTQLLKYAIRMGLIVLT